MGRFCQCIPAFLYVALGTPALLVIVVLVLVWRGLGPIDAAASAPEGPHRDPNCCWNYPERAHNRVLAKNQRNPECCDDFPECSHNRILAPHQRDPDCCWDFPECAHNR